jgi:hypothetical protein
LNLVFDAFEKEVEFLIDLSNEWSLAICPPDGADPPSNGIRGGAADIVTPMIS